MTPQLFADIEGTDILLIDDPENGTSIGPNGWLLENVLSADWVGYIAGGDSQCQMGCFAQPNQACLQEDAILCIDDSNGSHNGCLYCGPGTLAECTDFLSECSGDGDGGVDVTGNDDTADGGGLDTTGGGPSTPPDMSMFSNPNAIYVTTPYVLDWLGENAPDNLVSDICDLWSPQQAVQSLPGVPLSLDRQALLQVVDHPEAFLGHCDGLRLSMENDGVEIGPVYSETLTDLMQFQEGDIILRFNDVPTTDIVALSSALDAVAQSSSTLVHVDIERQGTMHTIDILVE